jgi:hypothetical protein
MNAPLGALAVAAVVIAVLVLVAPRVDDTPGPGVEPTASASATVAASPTWTAGATPGRLSLTWIRDVTLSTDRTLAHVVFAAGTCEYGYEGTARDVDGVLEIGIYELRDPAERPMFDASGRPVVCAGVGVWRSLDISLDAPFKGAVVRDLYGQTLWLEAPPWLAVVGGLPDGWALRREGNVLGNPTPRWERVWSPVRDPDPVDGDPVLTLIQSLGGPVGTEGGGEVASVEVNGQPASLSIDRYPFGAEMLLVWSIADSEFAIVGWDYDFTRQEFIRLAESITLRTPSAS